MNKRQLLQTFQNLYEQNKKLSKSQHNKLVYYLKVIDKIERENSLLIDRMLNKTKHVITVKTKVRPNNDYNEQLKTLKNQCKYTFDCFNFVTLLEQGKPKQVKKTKNKKQKAKKEASVKVIKASEKQKDFKQAFSDCLRLATIKQASK